MPHGAASRDCTALAVAAVLVLQVFVVRAVAVIAARFRAAAVVGVSVSRSGERARCQINDLRCLSPVALLGCHSPRLLTFEGSTLDSQYHRGHPTRAAHYHLEQPPRSKLAASGGLVVVPWGGRPRRPPPGTKVEEKQWDGRAGCLWTGLLSEGLSDTLANAFCWSNNFGAPGLRLQRFAPQKTRCSGHGPSAAIILNGSVHY